MPQVRRAGSRALFPGLLLALGAAAAMLLPPAAHAQSSTDPTTLRAEADALSSRYFDSLARVQSLDDQILRNEQSVADMQARATQARDAARARALIAYTTSGTQLATLVEGESALDTARRAQLIDRVNAHDQDVYDELQRATRALRKQQQALEDARAAQSAALDDVRAQGAAIDAKLAQAEAQARAQAASAATPTAAPSATAAPAPSSSNAPSGAATTTPATTAPPTTAPPAPAPAPAAPTPPAYSGNPGVSPHHDDPFLTCVRRRESGGNYGIVNPSGPYLGAYQFLQSTWNVTVAHAGRADLVGVPANQASPYDQDEMAWSLYQWQGTRPWGGGC